MQTREHARGGDVPPNKTPPPTHVSTPLVASSGAMQAVVTLLHHHAIGSSAPVLIDGETGTGKSLVAATIHKLGQRPQSPLTTIDCRSLSADDLRLELFGAAVGNGTDCTDPVHLDLPHGATVVFDEVGELEPDAQALLCALLERLVQARRRGSGPAADFRVLATTSANLPDSVRAGDFDGDLYQQLSVRQIHLPPLRDRLLDIPDLARTFAQEVGVDLPERLVAPLLAHRWPGNVRELHHAIHHWALDAELGETQIVSAMAAEPVNETVAPLSKAREDARDAFERSYLAQVLDLTGGNLTHAARLARVSRSYLMRLAAKHRMRICDRD